MLNKDSTITKDHIIYENDDYLVLNKPHGVVVNSSKTTSAPTVQDFLFSYLDLPKVSFWAMSPNNVLDDADAYASEFLARSGIVHRLDKDTSGVLLVAKNEETFIDLQRQFKERSVNKEYVALVYGEVKDAIIEISAPIVRDPKNRTRFAISKEGKEAYTLMHLLHVFEVFLPEGASLKFSLVRCIPKTGRTHQLRVHMCSIGHTIVADAIYAGAYQKRLAKKLEFTRMMLHAHKISFTYKKELVSYIVTLDFFPHFMHYDI